MDEEFRVGRRRRQIEDSIVARFRTVDFTVKHHAYLEDEKFWDFVFSWYELVKYYEDSGDNTLGAHMLQLFADCSHLFRQAASDARLTERRRDKAADALYQITYYVNQMAIQVRRNGMEQEDSTLGQIQWKVDDEKPSDLN
jgi:hypothetical protein